MLPSEVVANYYIQKSFDTGVPLSLMQLIKLVYIAHGWHRGYFSENLINDAVQAWQYGPVIPDLYRKLKHYGRSKIDSPIEGFPPIQQCKLPSPHTLALLDRVWDQYSSRDGIQLSALTHQQGTPWDEVWNSRGGSDYYGAIIPNDLIDAHYKQKIAAAK